MFNIIKNLLKMGPTTDFAALVKQGAIILDVRSLPEYNGGHIKGSMNIAVDVLSRNLYKLPDKTKPIITCCATGARSESAKTILQQNGYAQVYNGGGWSSLQKAIQG